MENVKNHFASKEFIFFLTAGGAGTLSNFAISSFLSLYIDPVVSYVFGYLFSLIVTYLINAKIAFKAGFNFVSFVKFAVSYFPNFLILVIVVYIFVEQFGFNPILSYGIAALTGIPLTFLLVKFFAFGREQK